MPSATPAMSKPKIMIVDDSALVRETVTMMLEERGYDVVAMDTVFTFVKTVNEQKPDLVLIDVMMPAMTGDKLVEIARRHQSGGCPMVLFSDRNEDHLAKLASACGAAGYIQKTGNGDALARSIARYLVMRGK